MITIAILTDLYKHTFYASAGGYFYEIGSCNKNAIEKYNSMVRTISSAYRAADLEFKVVQAEINLKERKALTNAQVHLVDGKINGSEFKEIYTHIINQICKEVSNEQASTNT